MRQLLLCFGMMVGSQVSAGVVSSAGTDAGSGISYVLISADGRLAGIDAAKGVRAPRLTAQCTKGSDGKLRFEMLADFGDIGSISYVAPWKPNPNELFPPRTIPVQITMEFLGYTKVKPAKREWDELPGIGGEWKYATPGLSSRNMEPIDFYLRYLKALPTLRLSLAGKAAAEWETTTWQAAIKAEPLCAASGL